MNGDGMERLCHLPVAAKRLGRTENGGLRSAVFRAWMLPMPHRSEASPPAWTFVRSGDQEPPPCMWVLTFFVPS
jgi:hypothetical protein